MPSSLQIQITMRKCWLQVVGNITLKGDADITADSISITAGNEVAVHDINLHASDINVNGTLTAAMTAFGDLESTEEEIVSLGNVHLDGDASYDDLANITAANVKVSTTKSVILSSTDITAAADELVWFDDTKFTFDYGLAIDAANITTSSGAQVEADSIDFTATEHIELNANVTATTVLSLDAATLDIQFNKLIAASLGITTSNNIILADDSSEQAYIDALSTDLKFDSSLDYDGDLSLTAAAITITDGNTVTASNIRLESSNTVILGNVIADNGDVDAATFGAVTLSKSADYSSLGFLSFSSLSLESDQDIIFSVNAGATANAGDILWIDADGFAIGGDLSIVADTLSVGTSTELKAYNLNLNANTYDVKGTLKAEGNSTLGSVVLSGGIDSTLDLASVTASDVKYEGDSIVWNANTTFSGDLYFDYDTFELKNNKTITGASVYIDADTSVSISGNIIAQGNGATGGDIDISAPSITLASTGLLDARLKNESSLVNAGDISLTAKVDKEVGFAEANSITTIELSGEIKAGNLDVKAESLATASYYSDIGATIALKAVAQYLGADFAYMAADADATINVNSGADIQTAGYVNINTVSHAITEAMAVAALGDVSGISLAGMVSVMLPVPLKYIPVPVF